MIRIWITQRGDGEATAAELEVGQRLQAAAQKRDREDAEQQGGADQHTRDIDSLADGGLSGPRQGTPRTYVQRRSLGLLGCR